MDIISKMYIGVDISKNSLDIYIYPIKKRLKIDNTKIAIKNFIKTLSYYDNVQIACEATGGYEKLLAMLLKQSNHDVWVVDPRRIKGFIISTGCKTKNDKIDAQKIAEFYFKNTRDYVAIEATENQVQLQSLVNRKNDLTKFLAMEKTRLESPSHVPSLQSIKRLCKVLDKEIKLIEKQMSNPSQKRYGT